MPMTEADEVAWSHDLFHKLAPGGTWAVPRSGMIFEKRGDALVLVAQMPHVPEMPITAEQLAEQQQSDFDSIADRFGKAGVTVRRG
jgi:hypothetical protein